MSPEIASGPETQPRDMWSKLTKFGIPFTMVSFRLVPLGVFLLALKVGLAGVEIEPLKLMSHGIK